MDNFDGGSVVYGHLAGSGRFGQDSVDKLEEVLMGMINKDKQYRTRDGREVRIYAVDGSKEYPIHGAILTEGVWYSNLWTIDGNEHTDFSSERDLIEVKPRIQREYWVNVYENHIYGTKDIKNVISAVSSQQLKSRIKITIDCEEGEGL